MATKHCLGALTPATDIAMVSNISIPIGKYMYMQLKDKIELDTANDNNIATDTASRVQLIRICKHDHIAAYSNIDPKVSFCNNSKKKLMSIKSRFTITKIW